MRISLEWLKTLVNIPVDVDQLINDMALTGTEIESVETTGAALEGVVTGQIVKKEKHENADTLWVTYVDINQGEPLQIVCGAQNFKQDDKVAVATVGTVLPGDFEIKKSKLRGVVSEGMNCSGKELGVSSDQEGILILPEDAPLGVPYSQYAGLSDLVLDAEITPNRPDCLSMKGIAREVGAIYSEPFNVEKPEVNESGAPVSDDLEITIDDSDRCQRYIGRVIENVEMRATPDWMVKRLEAMGARSINVVADVTNYVMFLLGQPLHAFDFDSFPVKEDGKRHVRVRAANENEKFTTLDKQERTLIPDMTVITDGEKPVALAGVMGGLESEVTDKTTTVLLESAIFSPAHTSRTSRNLQLISEASIRFERGVDPEGAMLAADMAAALIAELTGGTVRTGSVDVRPVEHAPVEVSFRPDVMRAVIGDSSISNAFARERLQLLGCAVDDSVEEEWKVLVPSYRVDLEREYDLIEEVLRLWGMENVPSTIPAARGHAGGLTSQQAISKKISSLLRAQGLNETLTYAFAGPDDLAKLRMSEEGRGEPARLLNPLSAEQSELRRSQIPNLLRSVEHNLARGVQNVHLFEVGNVFFGKSGSKQPDERMLISGVLAGSWNEDSWNEKARQLDFYDVKGVVETLLRELAVEKVGLKPAEDEQLFPGRGAHVFTGGKKIGWLGELHPQALEAYDISIPVLAFELDHDVVVEAARPSRAFVPISNMPSVSYDLAFVVSEDVTAEKMLQVIMSAGGKLLESAQLFDVFRDEERVGKGLKSMAYSLTFRAEDKTLTSQEVDKLVDKIIRKVKGATGAEVRG